MCNLHYTLKIFILYVCIHVMYWITQYRIIVCSLFDYALSNKRI